MDNTLKSKKKIFIALYLLALVSGLFGMVATVSIMAILDGAKEGIPFYKTPFFLLPISLFFIGYTIYYILTYFPSFEITKNGIKTSTTFKSKFYNWKEIARIELTGKQSHKFMFVALPAEATTIILKDGSEIYVWADYYRNNSDLRLILERAGKILKSEQADFSKLHFDLNKPTNLDSYYSSSFGREFNGNHLATFNGLFMYGWVAFMLYFISLPPKGFIGNPWAMLSVGFTALLIPGVLSYQMHYFIITDKSIIVKNTIWFWRKDVYPFENIREVVAETPHRLETSLRIITTAFRDKLYPAGSLKDETWRQLIAELETHNLKVRNETINMTV